MFESIRNLFGSLAESRARQKRRASALPKRRANLGVERLEERALMAADVPDYMDAAPYLGVLSGMSVQASSLDGYSRLAATSGQALHTSASVADIANDRALTPEVLYAMEDVRMGRATPQQRALLFVNNDIINQGRLNGWIKEDALYQAAQADFKALNDDFVKRSAQEVGGEFGEQKPKKTGFSPGTDSDYIVKIKSHDPVGDVRSMQRLYNTYVNQWLDRTLGTQQARELYRSNWENRLDTDFMVDPKYVTDEQFKEIAKLNNDAYQSRLAADFERISRLPVPEHVTDAHIRDYALEMQEFIKKKQDHLAALRADPAKLKNPAFAAELHRLMALEQKYIDRIEVANAVLRKQEGLLDAKPLHAEAHYRASTNAKGEMIVKQRTSETIAARGAVRHPENFRMTSTASSLAPLTAQQAMRNLAESMVEANVKNAKTGTIVRNLTDVGQDVGKMIASLPDAEKGRLIENLRRQHGDKIAAKIVEGMHREYKTTPGNPLDNMLKNALRVSDDVRGMSNLRRSFNEFAGKTLKIVDKFEALGNVMMIKDALVEFKTIVTYINEALNPSLTDAEADQLFHKAMGASQSMIETGGMGMLFAKVPTLAAMYGAWTLGFDGTRFILENTETGQWLERQKDEYGDRMLKAYDTAVDQLTELLGGTSQAMEQKEQLLALETNLLRLLREGKATLREGVRGIDVLSRIRSGDLVGLDELINVSGSKRSSGAVVVTDMGWVRDTVNPAWARPMQMITISGSISGNMGSKDKKVSYSLSLKQYDELLPNLKYDGMASQGYFVALDPRLTGSLQYWPVLTAGKTGEYVLTVTVVHIQTWPMDNPTTPRPTDWSIPFTMDIRVLGQSVRIGEPGPITAAEWSQEVARLNKMTAAQAGQDILQQDLNRRIEIFDYMTAKRASEVLWTYSWTNMMAALDRMAPDRVAEIISNYSPTNRTATLDKMTAKRASEVIKGYDTWTDRIATLDKMTAKRVAEVIGSYSPTDRTATLDNMSAKRASEVIWNYGWTDRIAELERMTSKRAADVIWNYSPTDRTATLDRMTAKRASEVIWNYNWTNLTATLDRMTAKRASEVIWNYSSTNRTATLDRMTAKRASEVIWNYNWTNLTATLDRMTAKRASEVIWNYNWTNLTATLDHMTAKRAAQVIAQYSSAVKTDVLKRLSPARRSEIAKFL